MPEQQPQHHDLELAVGVQTSVTSVVHKPAGRIGEVLLQWVGGRRPRSSSAAVRPDGTVDDHLEAEPPNKDRDELRTARVLVERLILDGASWDQPEWLPADARTERGIDCRAVGPELPPDEYGRPHRPELLIQVTHADSGVWATRARQSDPDAGVDRNASIETIVEALHAAIDHKRLRADETIVLALDAGQVLRAALQTTAEAFRRQHGPWAADIGFDAIWLVGPTAHQVYRLDQDGHSPELPTVPSPEGAGEKPA